MAKKQKSDKPKKAAKEKKPTAKKEKKAAKPKPARAPRASGGSASNINFICSECYEEFSLTRSEMDETLTCPECLHVGKRPEEDFLRTVRMHKAGEKRSLTMAAACFVGMVVCLIGAAWALSPNGQESGEAMLPILGGIGGLCALAAIFLGIRYEKNRWEVYF